MDTIIHSSKKNLQFFDFVWADIIADSSINHGLGWRSVEFPDISTSTDRKVKDAPRGGNNGNEQPVNYLFITFF